MKEVKGLIKSTKHLSALSLLMEQNNIDNWWSKILVSIFLIFIEKLPHIHTDLYKLVHVDNRHEQVYILFVEDVLSIYLAVSFVGFTSNLLRGENCVRIWRLPKPSFYIWCILSTHVLSLHVLPKPSFYIWSDFTQTTGWFF